MRLPQIILESQSGTIGLNINKPVQEIEQPKADVSIEQKPAEMIINRQSSKLTIDQTLARENLDLKSVFKRMDDNADLGFQTAMEYIAKVSQEGDELMNIAKVKVNPVLSQAERALSSETTFNTGNVPSQQSVNIDYTPASVDIEWIQHKPDIQLQVNKPVHTYTPGTTEVKMEQYPSLKIDFTG